MTRIKIEIDVPNGKYCTGTDNGTNWHCIYIFCDYCNLFRDFKSSNKKCPKCLKACEEAEAK